MRRVLVVVFMAALLAAAASYAQQPPPRRADRSQQMRPAPPGQREAPNRDSRERDTGPAKQMSPEDRRQLRRDISDYGRDIYRDRGRR